MANDTADQLREQTAELERQLAECRAERDAAIEQQNAIAEILHAINSSPGDLGPVFEAVVQRAAVLCEADEAALRTFDGELLQLVAAHGVTDAYERLLELGPSRMGPASLYFGIGHGDRATHIEDVRDSVTFRENEPARRRLELRGVRTWLAVALRREDALLGVINVHRRVVRPFTNKQIALLQNFAAQAVIAMENARLITETREALEQQTAAAEVLGIINASPGNLAPVFDAILENATKLCGAAFGALSIYCGDDHHQIVAMRNVPAAIGGLFGDTAVYLGPETGMGRLVRGEAFVHIADASDDDGYRMGNPLRRALVDLAGTRTYLAVPLTKDGALLGAFTIYRQQISPFTGTQIALLQNFAAQAVIAMENARLITETREALEQQTATAEVLQVINASPGDLDPVFEAMLDKAMRLCEAAFGQFATYDGDLLSTRAIRGPPEIVMYMRSRPPVAPKAGQNSTIERLSRGEQLIHIPDAKDDEAYRRGNPNRRALVDLGGCRTLLMVALRKDEEVAGVIEVYRQEVRPFTDQQIALLQNFAAQAVIAIENARLLGELRKRTEEVAELNRGLEARVAEQVEELGRIGRLKRFLAPQLAELIVSQGDENILESHRREIVVVFCDLRGYTAFTETAEPEEVLDFLREYHGALGPLVSQFEGTLDQFSGDGIMVFFNDPVPIPDPAERAVEMAMAMREAAAVLITHWRERGRDLGFGVGIAQGYATLGQIGFSERSGYTAIGTVCNVAARLCAEAKDTQILVSQRVHAALKGGLATEQLGALALKGLTQPVLAYNVSLAATKPALRVVEGGGLQSV